MLLWPAPSSACCCSDRRAVRMAVKRIAQGGGGGANMGGRRGGMAAGTLAGATSTSLAFGLLLAALPWLSTATLAESNEVGFRRVFLFRSASNISFFIFLIRQTHCVSNISNTINT